MHRWPAGAAWQPARPQQSSVPQFQLSAKSIALLTSISLHRPPCQVAELKAAVSGALSRFTSGEISADQLTAFLSAMGVELRCRWVAGAVLIIYALRAPVCSPVCFVTRGMELAALGAR